MLAATGTTGQAPARIYVTTGEIPAWIEAAKISAHSKTSTEPKKLQAQTLALLDNGLIPEREARERLSKIKDDRAETQAALESASLVDAPAAQADLAALAAEYGQAIENATPEEFSELLWLLVPVPPLDFVSSQGESTFTAN